jgi:hypothetical protein
LRQLLEGIFQELGHFPIEQKLLEVDLCQEVSQQFDHRYLIVVEGLVDGLGVNGLKGHTHKKLLALELESFPRVAGLEV